MRRRCELVELRHLHCFLAAAEHGSFRKASLAIGLQQSTISRCIRDLEDRMGASLFHRHSYGVRLTNAGGRFLPRARQIIRSLGEGAAEVSSMGRSEQGRIRIGLYSSIASGFLAELLSNYGRWHNKVDVELVDGNPYDHVAAIRQFELDIAFLTGSKEWSGCEQIHLWSERIFIVLPDNHALVPQTELTWQQLATEAFIVSEAPPGQEIHDHLVRRLADLGSHPTIHVHSVGRDNLLPLVAIDRGLTLVSEAMTVAQFPGIVYRPIKDEILPFSAVWSPANDNPAFRRLLNMAKGKAMGQPNDTVNHGDQELTSTASPSQTHDPSP